MIVFLLGSVVSSQIGPGAPVPDASALSDQKIGSVLIYNLYTSSPTDPNGVNTDLSITNTHTTATATVHLFFVNSSNSRAADTFISLAAKQTMSLLASDYDPGITGYVVAVAVDATSGCSINFNYLTGDAYIKTTTGHVASLGAQAVAAFYGGTLLGCSVASTSAVLNFDENPTSGYNRLPRVLMVDNIPSRSDGNDTLLVYNRIGGSFVQGSASTTGNLFGILYNDAEDAFSFTLGGATQARITVSDNSPRLTPRFGVVVPAGRSSWMKLFNPNSDFAITGAVINRHAAVATNRIAYEGGHNLRALSLAGNNALTIPVSMPSASVDLDVALAQSSFNIGSPGSYTITVSNPGTKAANGTISVFDTLPGNLTLASASGTGWGCSGIGTANVVCSNISGLAGGGASLPPLTLNVNVGAGTPPNISNTVTVANAGDHNPLNDQATDNATVTGQTPTLTALASTLPVSTFGQSVTFTATVTATAGSPNGTVEFFDGVTSLGTQPLSSGVAMLNTAALSVGFHTISAVYSGDVSFAGSRSAGLLQTVNAVSRTATTTGLVASVNPSVLGQNVNFTATVSGSGGPPTGTVQFFDGAVSLGTRLLGGAGTAVLSLATLAAGTPTITAHTITAQYLGDPNFAPSTSATVSQMVTQSDVGLPFATNAENSDQKTGSVLIYNLYRSSAATPATDNTDISLTNTNTSTSTAATVHLFFVRGASGVAADTFITLLPNQTKSFLASDFDPGGQGYLVAVAVNGAGCPVSFNYLMGDAYIKQPSGHRAALSAQAFAARYSGTLAGCSSSASINFDGISYDRLPRVLALNSIGSRADNNDTLLVVNNIGGSLLFGGGGATALGNFQGTLYNDAENAFAWTATHTATQFISQLNNPFPAVTPQFNSVLPAGRSGWLKLFTNTNAGLTGAMLNFNPFAASQVGAFKRGENLHTLTLADPVALLIPVYPSTTVADLSLTKTHAGIFTLGTTGAYNITVSNAPGAKSAVGTIQVSDTLPGNLTLAGFSGAGWACTGLGTANVVCTNNDGLAAGSSLAVLTLTVNIGGGTPVGTNSITNTATVALTPPQETNTANNSASDPTSTACPVITVGPAALPAGVAGTAYSQSLSAAPGGTTYSFSLTGGALPPGLMLASNGVISGTPLQSGSFSFTIMATGFGSCTSSISYTSVFVCPAITLASLPSGLAGTAYSQTLSANPANGAPYSFAVTGGALPPGLTLASNGTLSGTPTTGGISNFTVTATGFNNTCGGSQSYQFVVNCPTVTLAPVTLPDGQTGASYSQTISASPVNTSYSFAVSGGALPPGLALNTATGVLSGTPAAGGNFAFTITATGFGICSGARAYNLLVTSTCATITVNPVSLPSGTLGLAYLQTVNATGGVAPYTFSVFTGALPGGLVLNATTGQISGTPTATGTFVVTIRATGVGGCTGQRTYVLTIGCGTVTVNPVTLPNGTKGVAYNQTLTASPAGTYTFNLQFGSLPPGFTLSSAGVLSGTSSTTGTYTFTIRARTASGCQGTRQYTVSINP